MFPDRHLALLGSSDEARAAAKTGLALDPSFTIRRFRDGVSTDNSTYLAGRERICDGMRLAGVQKRGEVRCGSFASIWPRADEFRSTPINRHHYRASGCLKCANRRHMPIISLS